MALDKKLVLKTRKSRRWAKWQGKLNDGKVYQFPRPEQSATAPNPEPEPPAASAKAAA